MGAHDSAPYALQEVRTCCRFVSSSMFPCITLEDVAVLGECCPSGRDSSLNLLVMDFASDAVSLSQVDVAFNVHDLSVVDILYCCVDFHHHLSTCSSSTPHC